MVDAELSGKTILLTGATGFIGARLLERLRGTGAQVHAVSRSHEPGEQNDVRWWRADLADTSATRRVVDSAEPSVLIHLAGLVVGAPDLDLVIPTFRSNLLSTLNLLVAAQHSGCERIIITGSMVEPDPLTGDPTPNSPYAATKWAGSGYDRMFLALYESPIVNLRVHMVYGPTQRDLQKLIPYVILSFLTGRPPTLSSGRLEIDWVYLDDVVEAYVAAVSAEDAEGQTIDVGSGELFTMREVVRRLAVLTDTDVEPAFGTIGDRPLERAHVADMGRAYEILGWRPQVSLDEGLARTVAHYKELIAQGKIRSDGALTQSLSA